jgi:hypothetical protein
VVMLLSKWVGKESRSESDGLSRLDRRPIRRDIEPTKRVSEPNKKGSEPTRPSLSPMNSVGNTESCVGYPWRTQLSAPSGMSDSARLDTQYTGIRRIDAALEQQHLRKRPTRSALLHNAGH